MLLYTGQFFKYNIHFVVVVVNSTTIVPISRGLKMCVYTLKTEKAMATHSSTLAWKIPWMKEPGVLQSMGSLRVGHG